MDPVAQKLVVMILIGYLVGSIPFGLFVGWSRGVDVRKAGSGNIGASNVGRLLGRRFFFYVLILDALKGAVPMLLASWIAAGSHSGGTQTMYALCLSVGFAAIVGHMFSIFLKFRGGKGVATSGGVLLGFWPYYTLPGVVTVSTFIILFMLTRYISIGSIGAAIIFPISYVIIGYERGWDPAGRQWPLLAFAVVISILVVWKHRTNIARLRAGTENRMTRKTA